MEPKYVKMEFPAEWLHDKETRSKLWMFSRDTKPRNVSLPKRFRKSTTDTFMRIRRARIESGAYDTAYNAIEADYLSRHPSRTVSITVWRLNKTEQPVKPRLRRSDGTLIVRTVKKQNDRDYQPIRNYVLSFKYWDETIEEEASILPQTPAFQKLLNVLKREKHTEYAQKIIDLTDNDRYDNIDFLTLETVALLPRPTGALIDEPVRDGSASLPTHKNLLVHFWGDVFQPIHNGLAFAENVQGDCLPRAVVNALKPSFDKHTEKAIKTLTIQHVLDVCGTSEEMSIPQLKPFLRKYRITCVVRDVNDVLLWEYDPASDNLTRNKKMRSRLDIIRHNSHVELLNHDVHALEREPLVSKEDAQKPLYVSKHFSTPSFMSQDVLTTYEEVKHFLATKPVAKLKTKGSAPEEPDHSRVYYRRADCPDCKAIKDDESLTTVKDILRAKKEHSAVCPSPDLTEVFSRLTEDVKLEARLSMSAYNEIKSLTFIHPAVSIMRSDVNLSTLKALSGVFHRDLKSHYSTSLMEAFSKDYRKAQLVCRFSDTPEPLMTAHFIDRVRSYTDNAVKLEFIPVFDCLDEFMPYKPHALEPYTLYLIKTSATDTRSLLIANRQHSIVSGMVLLASGMTFQILAQCRPSSLKENPLYGKHGKIAELYKNPSEDLKAINLIFGMAGKTVNQKVQGIFTTSETEAWDLNDTRLPIKVKDGYISTRASPVVPLVDGFYPLQFMVYDMQRLRMLELYDRLIADGVAVYGIKTDCFFVDHIPAWEYHTGPKTFESLGKLRADCDTKFPGPPDKPNPYKIPLGVLELAENELLTIITPTPYTQVDTVQPNTFIGGKPGTSKTGDATRFMGCWRTQPVLPTKSLIVSFSNEAQHTERKRTHNADYACYAKLMGDRINDNKEVSTNDNNRLNLSDYTHVLLDEICLLDTPVVSRLVKILEEARLKNPALSFLATGDYDQNSTQRGVDRESFFEKCALWRLFPNRLYLDKNKRLQGENRDRDERLLDELYADFKAGVPVRTAIQRLRGFAKESDSLAFNQFVCFTNEQCALAENQFGANPTLLKRSAYDSKIISVRKLADKQKLPIQYDGYGSNIGFVMHEGKRHQFLISKAIYEPRYVGANPQGVQMVGVGQDLYKLSDFIGIHARTGHSAQGCTIEEPFLIIGWDDPFVDWRWMWTAITRCTRLADVHFYSIEVRPQKITNLNEKLRQYRATDAGKGHENDLTEDWVRATIKKQRYECANCNRMMTLEYKPGDLRQWSVDRRDNSLGHLQSNCWITCLSCNHRLAP